jgi:hypothetical protein
VIISSYAPDTIIGTLKAGSVIKLKDYNDRLVILSNDAEIYSVPHMVNCLRVNSNNIMIIFPPRNIKDAYYHFSPSQYEIFYEMN